MPRIGFETPPSVRELVELMNRTGRWELTFVDASGKVYGHYQTEKMQMRVPSTITQVLIYQGEVDDPDAHPLFTADTNEEAICFLYGMYLGVFGGKSLEAVQDELQRTRNERLY